MRKDQIVADSASPPMYLKVDLKAVPLSPELLGTKFDVILVDPWEECVRRAPGLGDDDEWWTRGGDHEPARGGMPWGRSSRCPPWLS